LQAPSTIDAKNTANTRPQPLVLKDVNSVEKRVKNSEATPVTRRSHHIWPLECRFSDASVARSIGEALPRLKTLPARQLID
jgi:hypothetical protein